VSWQEPTDQGAKRNLGFNSGGMTAGEARKVCMPADATGVNIIAHAAGGIGWVAGMNRGDVVLPGPDDGCYSISGTAFKTFSNRNCDPNTAGMQVVRGSPR
jgi:hypothetical protein